MTDVARTSTKLVCVTGSIVIPAVGLISLAAVMSLIAAVFHFEYIPRWIGEWLVNHLGPIPFALILGGLSVYGVWLWARILYPRCASARHGK